MVYKTVYELKSLSTLIAVARVIVAGNVVFHVFDFLCCKDFKLNLLLFLAWNPFFLLNRGNTKIKKSFNLLGGVVRHQGKNCFDLFFSDVRKNAANVDLADLDLMKLSNPIELLQDNWTDRSKTCIQFVLIYPHVIVYESNISCSFSNLQDFSLV